MTNKNYKSVFKNMLKESLLLEYAPPVVPIGSELTVPKNNSVSVISNSNGLVQNKVGAGFNNIDRKTRFGMGLGLINDQDYEILRQRGLKQGIDIDIFPNAYQAANVINQTNIANNIQDLANSMGIGSGHNYTQKPSFQYRTATEQQQQQQQQQQQGTPQIHDPYGFGLAKGHQGFGIRAQDWERAKQKALAMGIPVEELEKAPGKVMNMINQREISMGTYGPKI